MSVEDRLRSQLMETKRELERATKMLKSGEGMEEMLKREMEEALEREKEKRVEHTKAMAVRRILKRDLARGFSGWCDYWEEQAGTSCRRCLACGSGCRLARNVHEGKTSHSSCMQSCVSRPPPSWLTGRRRSSAGLRALQGRSLCT